MRIERLGPLCVVGLEVECMHGEVEESDDNPVTRLWSEFHGVVDSLPGIPHDVPYLGITHSFDAHGFTYLAGVAVSAGMDHPNTVMRTFPAMEYAVADFRGPLEGLEDGWNRLYAWMGSHGLANDTRFMEAMEVYGPGFRGRDARDSVLGLYLPVLP